MSHLSASSGWLTVIAGHASYPGDKCRLAVEVASVALRTGQGRWRGRSEKSPRHRLVAANTLRAPNRLASAGPLKGNRSQTWKGADRCRMTKCSAPRTREMQSMLERRNVK